MAGGFLRGHGSLAIPLLQLRAEPGQPQPCLGIVACSVETAVCRACLVGFWEVWWSCFCEPLALV